MLLAYVQNHHNYKPGAYAWIGASDMNAEGTFRWTGPGRHNSGVPFWEGGTDGTAVKGRSITKLCWTCHESHFMGIKSSVDRYNNWAINVVTHIQLEPNQNGQEDCVGEASAQF